MERSRKMNQGRKITRKQPSFEQEKMLKTRHEQCPDSWPFSGKMSAGGGGALDQAARVGGHTTASVCRLHPPASAYV